MVDGMTAMHVHSPRIENENNTFMQLAHGDLALHPVSLASSIPSWAHYPCFSRGTYGALSKKKVLGVAHMPASRSAAAYHNHTSSGPSVVLGSLVRNRDQKLNFIPPFAQMTLPVVHPASGRQSIPTTPATSSL